MERNQLKVGVKEGSGPAPGYAWTVGILDLAYRDTQKVVTDAQYRHLADQVRDLARSEDPTHCETQSVDAIEDYFELRDKGGILGKLNVRIFWAIDKARRVLVILGFVAKKNEGQTAKGDKIRMRRRWRQYRNGEFGFLE